MVRGRGGGLGKGPLNTHQPCLSQQLWVTLGSLCLLSSAPALDGSFHGQGPALLLLESATAGASPGCRAVSVRAVTRLLPYPISEHPTSRRDPACPVQYSSLHATPRKKAHKPRSLSLLFQPPGFPGLSPGRPGLAVPCLSRKVPGTPQDIPKPITWGFPR